MSLLRAVLLVLPCISPITGLILRDKNSTKGTAVKDEADMNRRFHQCLTGKRIVFIGPSTSKFDYLALTYFIEYGRWPVEAAVPCGPAATGPNPLYEWNVRNALKDGTLPPDVVAPNNIAGCNTGGGTETFIRYTNHMFNKHEVCDCHQNGDWRGAGDFYNATENRVYWNGDTMVSYFQWFGDIVSPRGTVDIGPALQGQPQAVHPQCPVGQFPGTWAWNMPMDHFLSNVVKYANPTHIVISAAFWPSQPENAAFWDGLAKAGADAVSNSHGQVYWRTTPQRTEHAPTDPASKVDQNRFLQNGWKVFPAQQIVLQFQNSRPDDQIFYDFTHLRPPAATHLMKTWLEQDVCPAGAR